MSKLAIRGLFGVASMGFLISCGGSGGGTTTTNVAVTGPSSTEVVSPLAMKQFANPLPIIPVAPPNTTFAPNFDYYTVAAEQTSNFDFGLRKGDGTDFLNPVTGAPIRTTVWGYTINGIKAGYLGATIEARSTLTGETGNPKPTQVKYINDLKDGSGALLTKHLLAVDPTLDGAKNGESELRISTHLHGGHVKPEFDGHPLAWVTNDPNALTGLPADLVSGRPARPNGNSATFDYPNDQLAAHVWFHDHSLGVTRINVYAGLAANYIIRDNFEAGLNLPAGAYEIPLVIQDKSFNQDGSLHYSSVPLVDITGNQVVVNGEPVLTSNPEFFGNAIVVNGKVWPYLEVEPRKYRFRMLNGSDSRFYNMWLELVGGGAIPANAIRLIGNEGGLLPTTVAIGDGDDNKLLMAPGERDDVIIDFSLFTPGASVTLRNDGPSPYPFGDPVAALTTGRIMQFRVTQSLAGVDSSVVPPNPRAPQRPLPWTPSKTLYFDLQEMDETGRYTYNSETGTLLPRLKLSVNGREFTSVLDATEYHNLDAIEDWVIINSTGDMHPMHLHLVNFEVLEKGTIDDNDYEESTEVRMPVVTGLGLKPNFDLADRPRNHLDFDSAYTVGPDEMGWKETVRVPPASSEPPYRVGYVKVRAKFDTLGTYMWHCHILAHEENEMMRPFRVVEPLVP